MGSSSVLQFFTPQLAPASPPISAAQRLSATRCRFSARYGGESPFDRANERPRFVEEYRSFGDYDDDPVYGFNTAAKQRVWWSDDDESSSEADYYDEDEDDDGFGPFGDLESSIGFTWIFKLLRAFGWMIPAITISMLLGTGPNAFIMALALPLAQSAVSLVVDVFSERPSDVPSARPKKRPFRRSKTNSADRERAEYDTQARKKKVGDYQSWVAANHVSGKAEERSTRFGGWDELDKQGRMAEEPRSTSFRNTNEPRKQRKSKLSKRRRKGESPLLIRLLMAVFPFFGFWTKLM